MINDVDYEEYMVDWRNRVDSGELTENVRSNSIVKHTYLDPETGREKTLSYSSATGKVY